MSDGRRAFMMGNALVVGAVETVANELIADIVVSEPARRAVESLEAS